LLSKILSKSQSNKERNFYPLKIIGLPVGQVYSSGRPHVRLALPQTTTTTGNSNCLGQIISTMSLPMLVCLSVLSVYSFLVLLSICAMESLQKLSRCMASSGMQTPCCVQRRSSQWRRGNCPRPPNFGLSWNLLVRKSSSTNAKF